MESKRNMAHRTILTERQRSALFDLPNDELSLLRHYTLAFASIALFFVAVAPILLILRKLIGLAHAVRLRRERI